MSGEIVFFQDKEETDEEGMIKPIGWYFWDEIWAYTYGPYNSKEEAESKLDEYCAIYLNRRK